MFWADEVVPEVERMFPGKKKIIVRDEKTASGRVHVGSLRGVVIHGVAAQALIEKGFDAKFYYEINDADPMDGMPIYLSREKFLQHMGKPLKDVPSPESPDTPATEEKNFARYFGDEFVSVIRRIGFDPIIYLSSTLYAEGKFDHWIDLALEGADQIRQIYREVSGSEKGEDWNPVQVVCEKCGKVGTTTVIGFSGDRGKRIVEYVCDPKKVKWAVGCGHRGNVSPYRSRGKLPWKVEWAAKWQIFPVDVEGAGKDHAVVGGSRATAARIAKEVFKGQVPVNIPYEFFTLGGAKMSASKGIGASAAEIAEMLPEELLRFLMVRTRPERTIDFDPTGGTMPRLFDMYDESADVSFGRKESEIADDVKRSFHFSHASAEHARDVFRPRFSRVAFLLQMPQLDFFEEVTKLKGAPLTKEDRAEAEFRKQYAEQWLKDFASDDAKFSVQQALPKAARQLSEEQKAFLREIAEMLQKKEMSGEDDAQASNRASGEDDVQASSRASGEDDVQASNRASGEELHAALHELRKTSPLKPAEAFQAVYLALLGKSSGPQAGWFLDALPKKFVVERFLEAAALPEFHKEEIKDAVSSLAIMRKDVRQKFPGIKLGFSVLRGVNITASHPGVASLQQELWKGLDFNQLKKNSPRLEAFREIYRGFGVKPSNNKPSPVALVSRLANGKTLPNINVAVDIYNAVAVKHQLAIGLFDLDKIKLPIELSFARGGEKFLGLGMEKEAALMPGELCYFDASGIVMARDFNYLDSELTKVDEKTKNILLNVDGNQACSPEDVEMCLAELEHLLTQYCGGKPEQHQLLDAGL